LLTCCLNYESQVIFANSRTLKPTIMSDKKLSRKEGKILGVCAGLGEHFDIDATVVRIAFVIFTFFGGSGILLYLILALIMPKAY